MKRVFLDTNILIDFALDGIISLHASFLTFANMAYIMRNKVDVYELFNDLCKFISVLPMDEKQLHTALTHRVHDFEDMLQYQCATTAHCDVIVTNNRKDFIEFCDLPVMTAMEFLKSIE